MKLTLPEDIPSVFFAMKIKDKISETTEEYCIKNILLKSQYERKQEEYE